MISIQSIAAITDGDVGLVAAQTSREKSVRTGARELAGLRYAEHVIQQQNSTVSSLGDVRSTL